MFKRACLATVAVLALAPAAFAAEGGTGFYLLGLRATGAGVVPPAGTYFQFTFYGYSGGSSADIPLNGRLNLDLEGNAALGLATGVWSLDSGPVLGGQPYLTALVPFGWKETKLGATLTGPGGDVLSGSRQEDSFLIGDPAIGGGIGWKSENLLTSLNLLVNVPIGDYQQSRTTNISFNHWAGDLTAAATWLGADGWQLDGAAGLSVNAENPDTDYRTGNELHLEAAVAKTTGAWTVGLAGYHYQQITGDSGDGAVLGDFKGRVSALGPAVSWAGAVGKRPVAVDARWLHEFDAKNRVEGDALLFNVTVPLGG